MAKTGKKKKKMTSKKTTDEPTADTADSEDETMSEDEGDNGVGERDPSFVPPSHLSELQSLSQSRLHKVASDAGVGTLQAIAKLVPLKKVYSTESPQSSL